MNFQDLAEKFHSPTCIISVERKSDGGYGEIRLVSGNKSYLEPIEHPVFTSDPSILGIPEVFQSNNKFIPNSLYEKYLPKDTGFEDICYRAAVKKIPINIDTKDFFQFSFRPTLKLLNKETDVPFLMSL